MYNRVKDSAKWSLRAAAEALTNETHTTRSAFELLKSATINVATQISQLHHAATGIDITVLQKAAMMVEYSTLMYNNKELIGELLEPDISVKSNAMSGRIDRKHSFDLVGISPLCSTRDKAKIQQVNNDYTTVVQCIEEMSFPKIAATMGSTATLSKAMAESLQVAASHSEGIRQVLQDHGMDQSETVELFDVKAVIQKDIEDLNAQSQMNVNQDPVDKLSPILATPSLKG